MVTDNNNEERIAAFWEDFAAASAKGEAVAFLRRVTEDDPLLVLMVIVQLAWEAAKEGT